jgi:hypothetical protein
VEGCSSRRFNRVDKVGLQPNSSANVTGEELKALTSTDELGNISSAAMPIVDQDSIMVVKLDHNNPSPKWEVPVEWKWTGVPAVLKVCR